MPETGVTRLSGIFRFPLHYRRCRAGARRPIQGCAEGDLPMTMLPARTEIAPEFTWNATSVFESPEAWSAELGRLSDELQELSAFQGKLDSAARLADWFDRVATLAERVGHVF